MDACITYDVLFKLSVFTNHYEVGELNYSFPEHTYFLFFPPLKGGISRDDGARAILPCHIMPRSNRMARLEPSCPAHSLVNNSSSLAGRCSEPASAADEPGGGASPWFTCVANSPCAVIYLLVLDSSWTPHHPRLKDSRRTPCEGRLAVSQMFSWHSGRFPKHC